MKKLLWIVLGLAIIFGIYAFFFRSSGEIKLLVFSKTSGFRHESIEAGQEAILKMGEQHGFSVDTTEDASFFIEENLQHYNVIVFLNTTGDFFNDAQQLEFNRWIQAGGGYVGIHAAADAEYDWPWYNQLVGAWFDSHPLDPNVQEGEIVRLDAEHISTKHLPDRWRRTDEWYNYKSIQPIYSSRIKSR